MDKRTLVVYKTGDVGGLVTLDSAFVAYPRMRRAERRMVDRCIVVDVVVSFVVEDRRVLRVYVIYTKAEARGRIGDRDRADLSSSSRVAPLPARIQIGNRK